MIRPTRSFAVAGGKGFNVAWAIQLLGGQAMCAGLVTGFEMGLPAVDALHRAVAAGAANTLSSGGAQFKLSDFKAVMADITINRMRSL